MSTAPPFVQAPQDNGVFYVSAHYVHRLLVCKLCDMMGLLYVDQLDQFLKYAVRSTKKDYPFYLLLHGYDEPTLTSMRKILYRLGVAPGTSLGALDLGTALQKVPLLRVVDAVGLIKTCLFPSSLPLPTRAPDSLLVHSIPIDAAGAWDAQEERVGTYPCLLGLFPWFPVAAEDGTSITSLCMQPSSSTAALRLTHPDLPEGLRALGTQQPAKLLESSQLQGIVQNIARALQFNQSPHSLIRVLAHEDVFISWFAERWGDVCIDYVLDGAKSFLDSLQPGLEAPEGSPLVILPNQATRSIEVRAIHPLSGTQLILLQQKSAKYVQHQQVLCCSGFEKNNSLTQFPLVSALLGAELRAAFHVHATKWLVSCGDRTRSKVQAAIKKGVPVMTPAVLLVLLRALPRTPAHVWAEVRSGHQAAPFSVDDVEHLCLSRNFLEGKTVCFTGFDPENRARLTRKVLEVGGVCSDQLTENCFCLVTRQEAKGLKVVSALALGIPVVFERWVTDLRLRFGDCATENGIERYRAHTLGAQDCVVTASSTKELFEGDLEVQNATPVKPMRSLQPSARLRERTTSDTQGISAASLELSTPSTKKPARVMPEVDFSLQSSGLGFARAPQPQHGTILDRLCATVSRRLHARQANRALAEDLHSKMGNVLRAELKTSLQPKTTEPIHSMVFSAEELEQALPVETTAFLALTKASENVAVAAGAQGLYYLPFDVPLSADSEDVPVRLLDRGLWEGGVFVSAPELLFLRAYGYLGLAVLLEGVLGNPRVVAMLTSDRLKIDDGKGLQTRTHSTVTINMQEGVWGFIPLHRINARPRLTSVYTDTVVGEFYFPGGSNDTENMNTTALATTPKTPTITTSASNTINASKSVLASSGSVWSAELKTSGYAHAQVGTSSLGIFERWEKFYDFDCQPLRWALPQDLLLALFRFRDLQQGGVVSVTPTLNGTTWARAVFFESRVFTPSAPRWKVFLASGFTPLTVHLLVTLLRRNKLTRVHNFTPNHNLLTHILAPSLLHLQLWVLTSLIGGVLSLGEVLGDDANVTLEKIKLYLREHGKDDVSRVQRVQIDGHIVEELPTHFDVWATERTSSSINGSKQLPIPAYVERLCQVLMEQYHVVTPDWLYHSVLNNQFAKESDYYLKPDYITLASSSSPQPPVSELKQEFTNHTIDLDNIKEEDLDLDIDLQDIKFDDIDIPLGGDDDVPLNFDMFDEDIGNQATVVEVPAEVAPIVEQEDVPQKRPNGNGVNNDNSNSNSSSNSNTNDANVSSLNNMSDMLGGMRKAEVTRQAAPAHFINPVHSIEDRTNTQSSAKRPRTSLSLRKALEAGDGRVFENVVFVIAMGDFQAEQRARSAVEVLGGQCVAGDAARNVMKGVPFQHPLLQKRHVVSADCPSSALGRALLWSTFCGSNTLGVHVVVTGDQDPEALPWARTIRPECGGILDSAFTASFESDFIDPAAEQPTPTLDPTTKARVARLTGDIDSFYDANQAYFSLMHRTISGSKSMNTPAWEHTLEPLRTPASTLLVHAEWLRQCADANKGLDPRRAALFQAYHDLRCGFIAALLCPGGEPEPLAELPSTVLLSASKELRIFNAVIAQKEMLALPLFSSVRLALEVFTTHHAVSLALAKQTMQSLQPVVTEFNRTCPAHPQPDMPESFCAALTDTQHPMHFLFKMKQVSSSRPYLLPVLPPISSLSTALAALPAVPLRARVGAVHLLFAPADSTLGKLLFPLQYIPLLPVPGSRALASFSGTAVPAAPIIRTDIRFLPFFCPSPLQPWLRIPYSADFLSGKLAGGLRIYLSGFPSAAKARLTQILRAVSADQDIVVDTLTSSTALTCTHLIAHSSSGKVKFAEQRQIKVVSASWLIDSIQAGAPQDESFFPFQ